MKVYSFQNKLRKKFLKNLKIPIFGETQSDQFLNKLRGLIGNQKGVCRLKQGLKSKIKETRATDGLTVTKPANPERKNSVEMVAQRHELTEDSYLANLVIYLVNCDDEFKLDDEFIVDYMNGDGHHNNYSGLGKIRSNIFQPVLNFSECETTSINEKSYFEFNPLYKKDKKSVN